MAFLEIEYNSKVLEMERHINVIYPDVCEISPDQVDDEDIPVLYLLHGMGGNENSWRKRTNIERLLRHTNLIVVMPSTDLAWYTNTTYGHRYYDAIAKELSASREVNVHVCHPAYLFGQVPKSSTIWALLHDCFP